MVARIEPIVRQRVWLDIMKAAEAAGLVTVLVERVRRWKAEFPEVGNPAIANEYGRLAASSEHSKAVEIEYGQGSLLNLDHRVIKGMIIGGRISQSELRAAELYRSLLARRN